ncbi:MAG TPA: thioredoxin domain-containing protein [Candidatus Nanoarchaeia archaeon]|nr:thioredoxin domain-containing protein [Candidatus Nanoarchaeia archaeon]
MVTIKKRTIKRVIFWVAIIAVLVIGYQYFFDTDYPDINTPKPVFGNADATVQIIEFSDLQCPACKAAHPIVEQIKTEFGDRISFQYYHFPLRAVHPFAQKAAESVECANDQGKFFEYIDAAFAQSPNLQSKNLKVIASQVGLDRDKFDACLDSGAKRKVVEGDIRVGEARQIRGTPTFFINDKVLEDWDYAGFKAAIERELR